MSTPLPPSVFPWTQAPRGTGAELVLCLDSHVSDDPPGGMYWLPRRRHQGSGELQGGVRCCPAGRDLELGPPSGHHAPVLGPSGGAAAGTGEHEQAEARAWLPRTRRPLRIAGSLCVGQAGGRAVDQLVRDKGWKPAKSVLPSGIWGENRPQNLGVHRRSKVGDKQGREERMKAEGLAQSEKGWEQSTCFTPWAGPPGRAVRAPLAWSLPLSYLSFPGQHASYLPARM